MKKLLGLLLLGFVNINSASAMLIVDITGVAGSGQTLWTFSGSATAGDGGFFEDGADLSGNDTWQNVINYTFRSDVEATNVSGAATLTIGTTTRNIDLVYIDSDGGSGTLADDFGVGVDGSTNFRFSASDLVSWTGALTVIGIDLNDLDESDLPLTFSSSNYGDVARLDLTVNIGQPVSNVPTPATIWLLGLGLIGLVGLRRNASKISVTSA